MKNAQNSTDAPQWVTVKDIAKMFGIGKNSVFRMSMRGDFPKPLRLGHNRRWNVDEITAWIATQKGEINHVQGK